MGNVKGKPGVMLYFDLIEALERLSDKQRGKLLLGLLHYARDGTDPMQELDKLSQLVWVAMKPNVDRDDENYHKKVENAKRSVEKREARRKMINDILAESESLPKEMRRNLQEIATDGTEEAPEEKEEAGSWVQKLNPFEARRQEKIRQLEESGY